QSVCASAKVRVVCVRQIIVFSPETSVCYIEVIIRFTPFIPQANRDVMKKNTIIRVIFMYILKKYSIQYCVDKNKNVNLRLFQN
ncbi:MAG: hypothetical protein U0L77_00990, partial [Prevotellamassilia sp.]|nr:hypothetical protein [Prevotellamassilia sp.]